MYDSISSDLQRAIDTRSHGLVARVLSLQAFWVLAAALLAAVILSFATDAFATPQNLFNVTRNFAFVVIVAIGMTAVIITGGIDLSVGAMMGLAAILFGVAWRDWGLPLPAAAIVSLLVGLAGGGLNALLVARFGIPPLIVTLGTLSLFRGVAEGITQGAVNYTGFPARFLALGQGYLGGVVPAQLPIFLAVLAGYILLLHRSVIGRALYAIGFGPDGARYAKAVRNRGCAHPRVRLGGA